MNSLRLNLDCCQNAHRRVALVEVTRGDEAERARIMLGILESVGRDGTQTQRHLASELGVALGLVNAYLKRCVSKGLVKVRHVPARRYAYYLTPKGFSEKSRLTIEYLSYSFSFFREARNGCTRTFSDAKARGWTRVVLIGKSDLAEIARICALEAGVEVVAVMDAQGPGSPGETFIGVPVVALDDAGGVRFDGAVVTDLQTTDATRRDARERFGAERVLVPALPGLRGNSDDGAQS